MANHTMIDIETFDTRPSAVVFQVGVVIFQDVLYGEPGKPTEGNILDSKLFHLDVVPQLMTGRTVDKDTVDWWRTQPKFAWQRTLQDLCDPVVVFKDIKEMSGNFGVGHVWSNSPSFDAVIMRSLRESMMSLGREVFEFPAFRADLDLRSLKFAARALGVEFGRHQTSHNALQDALEQTEDALTILRKFRGMKNIALPKEL